MVVAATGGGMNVWDRLNRWEDRRREEGRFVPFSWAVIVGALIGVVAVFLVFLGYIVWLLVQS